MVNGGRTDGHNGSCRMSLRGVACALTGGALWGFSGTAVNYLFRESGIDPLRVMSVRMVLAGILFLLLFTDAGLFLNQFSYLIAIQGRIPPRQRSCRACNFCPLRRLRA